MTRGTSVVRLFAAVIVAFAACKFVNVYSQLSEVRFTLEHEGGALTPFNAFLIQNGIWSYVLPLLFLLVGIAAISRSPHAETLVELLASMLWIMAYVWAAIAVLAWHVQNIPIFSGMKYHF